VGESGATTDDMSDRELRARLLDPDAADVAAFARWVHGHGPVHQSQTGTVYTGHYQTCHSILRDPRLGKGRGSPDDLLPDANPATSRPLPDAMFTASLVHLNPPEHTRLRDVVKGAFTRSRVERLRPLIAGRADELLGRIREQGEAELVSELAYALSVWVIGELIGVPEPDRDQFRDLVRRQGLVFEPTVTDEELDDGSRAGREMAAYFARLLRERRREPCDDLLSFLLAARDGDGLPLTRQELVALPMLLMGAGFDTTTALIANLFGRLLFEPDQAELLRREPSLAASAVEEVLRCESPIQVNARVSLEPTEVGGKHLERGQWAIALIGVANRDPHQFTSPDELRVDRYSSSQTPPPLSFSAGIHHCLGAPLARLEATVVIERWLESGLDLEPLGSELVWRPHTVHHGVEVLEVTASQRPRGG